MKRLLSWIVTGVGIGIVYYPFDWLMRLVNWAARELSEINKILFVVIVLFAAGTILSFLFWVGTMGAGLLISLSQKIYKSKSGGRYVFFGVVACVRYALVIVLAIAGVAKFASPLHGYSVSALMVIFGIAFALAGKGVAKSDGPPPTKREILEAKLAKEKEKEDLANLMRQLDSFKTGGGEE